MNTKLIKKANYIGKLLYGIGNYRLYPSERTATFSPTVQYGYYLYPTVLISPNKMAFASQCGTQAGWSPLSIL